MEHFHEVECTGVVESRETQTWRMNSMTDSLSLNFLVYFTKMSSYFPMKTNKRKVRICLKGTLMQIWKSLCMVGSISKSYLQSTALLILIDLELYTREACAFFENWLNFQHILLFPYVCKQKFYISRACISQKIKGVMMWYLRYIIFK